MSADVTQLRALSWAGEVDKDVVATLETYLESAKTGLFRGVAIAAIARDGSVHTCATKTDKAPEMIGAVTLLQARVIGTAQREFIDP